MKALTAEVAKADAEAARYVHWGATSQDIIDTATMLTLRAGIDALVACADGAATSRPRPCPSWSGCSAIWARPRATIDLTGAMRHSSRR